MKLSAMQDSPLSYVVVNPLVDSSGRDICFHLSFLSQLQSVTDEDGVNCLQKILRYWKVLVSLLTQFRAYSC